MRSPVSVREPGNHVCIPLTVGVPVNADENAGLTVTSPERSLSVTALYSARPFNEAPIRPPME